MGRQVDVADHLPKPVFLKTTNSEVIKVAHLRNPKGKGWNKKFLHKLFNKEEIDLISRVNLSALGAKDRLVWKQTRNGQYSASSGYEFAKMLK